ncbi:cysteine proteinase [Ascodesmis nigricans]|uniref:Cysteine proteinase n=1 Tax=Ascodesmis nigricans TaxID=341454 RepID=A0A4S2MUR3_9PEZI|nr:cysteine proteinase [Ascodesmis nigricans]
MAAQDLAEKYSSSHPASALQAAALRQKTAPSVVATASFDEAIKLCQTKVKKISAACRRDNLKYRDIHFDLSLDEYFCTHSLIQPNDSNDDDDDGASSSPEGLDAATVARVHEVFEDPVFFRDGATAGDIKQGEEGDCWFLAAIATATNIKGLLEKVCVARDEAVGVYGFVFLRDSVWVSVIVDDQLLLKHHSFDDASNEYKYYFSGKDAYDKVFNRGSSALLCAKCEDENETWLPLLEKAYAKAHGDYESIRGGFTGEAVEDLTGGVTSELFTADILDRDAFWSNELRHANENYLFAAWTPSTGHTASREGIIKSHAYSVLRTVEANGKRLVLCRNPWGKAEYTGPWSDGSKEWTPEWLSLLEHKFGDDGQFWMEYRDFLKVFKIIDRTRLFDESWRVTEMRWVPYNVPWGADYAKTRYRLTVTKPTEAVIVLSQLDTRYFRGLEGNYYFTLNFRVHKKGEEDYIIRSLRNVYMSRSVSATLQLEPGVYDIIFSVESLINPAKTNVEEAVSKYKNLARKKFRQVARNADLSFEKAGCLSPWRDADIEAANENDALEPVKELAMQYWKELYEQEEKAKKQKQKERKKKKVVEEEEAVEEKLGDEEEWEDADENDDGEGDDSDADEKADEGDDDDDDDDNEQEEEEEREEMEPKPAPKSKKPKDPPTKDTSKPKAPKDTTKPPATSAPHADTKPKPKDANTPAEPQPPAPHRPNILTQPWLKNLPPKLYGHLVRLAENHSWNARVCVGLKVYSKDEGLTVDVVEPGRPNSEEEGESGEVVVDWDDSTRDVKKVEGEEVRVGGGEKGDVKEEEEKEGKREEEDGKKVMPQEEMD